MSWNTFRSLPLICAFGLASAAPSLLLAQANAAAPSPAGAARETPRPQDLEPGVNTSAIAPAEAARAREAPRPQDLDPAVNTSAPAAQSTTAPSVGNAAARKAPPNSATVAGVAPDAARAAGPQTPTQGQKSGQNRVKAKGKSLDRLELDTTQITGNRELPKVLYIVPWKRADLGDLVGKPVNSLLDEVLTPVDRDVFKRENRYYRALTPGAAAPANGASDTAGGTAGAAKGASASGSAAPAARDER